MHQIVITKNTDGTYRVLVMGRDRTEEAYTRMTEKLIEELIFSFLKKLEPVK